MLYRRILCGMEQSLLAEVVWLGRHICRLLEIIIDQPYLIVLRKVFHSTISRSGILKPFLQILRRLSFLTWKSFRFSGCASLNGRHDRSAAKGHRLWAEGLFQGLVALEKAPIVEIGLLVAQGLAVNVVNFRARKDVIENCYGQLFVIQNIIALKCAMGETLFATDKICLDRELMLVFLEPSDAFVAKSEHRARQVRSSPQTKSRRHSRRWSSVRSRWDYFCFFLLNRLANFFDCDPRGLIGGCVVLKYRRNQSPHQLILFGRHCLKLYVKRLIMMILYQRKSIQYLWHWCRLLLLYCRSALQRS